MESGQRSREEAEEREREERGRCSRQTDGGSVLSLVLGIQRRSPEARPQPSFDILTRVLGSGPATSPLQSDLTTERAAGTSSPLVSSLEVNLSDSVLARSITLENIQSRAEARIELVDSTVFPQSPPSYTTMPPPPEESTLFHGPPPPSYEQTFGIQYLDRDLPFIAINNASNNIWGHRTQPAFCFRCNAMVLTNVITRFCLVTHLTAFVSFLTLCWPCIVVPYIMPIFKEVHHHCPACNQFLGCYRPIARNQHAQHNSP